MICFILDAFIDTANFKKYRLESCYRQISTHWQNKHDVRSFYHDTKSINKLDAHRNIFFSGNISTVHWCAWITLISLQTGWEHHSYLWQTVSYEFLFLTQSEVCSYRYTMKITMRIETNTICRSRRKYWRFCSLIWPDGGPGPSP